MENKKLLYTGIGTATTIILIGGGVFAANLASNQPHGDAFTQKSAGTQTNPPAPANNTASAQAPKPVPTAPAPAKAPEPSHNADAAYDTQQVTTGHAYNLGYQTNNEPYPFIHNETQPTTQPSNDDTRSHQPVTRAPQGETQEIQNSARQYLPQATTQIDNSGVKSTLTLAPASAAPETQAKQAISAPSIASTTSVNALKPTETIPVSLPLTSNHATILPAIIPAAKHENLAPAQHPAAQQVSQDKKPAPAQQSVAQPSTSGITILAAPTSNLIPQSPQAQPTPSVAIQEKTSEKPITRTGAPAYADEKPAIMLGTPAIEPEKPAIFIPAPAFADEKPAIFIPAPAFADEKPANSVGIPLTEEAKPVGIITDTPAPTTPAPAPTPASPAPVPTPTTPTPASQAPAPTTPAPASQPSAPATQAPTPTLPAEPDFRFNPKDIVAEDDAGYFVRHHDHYHYILKKPGDPHYKVGAVAPKDTPSTAPDEVFRRAAIDRATSNASVEEKIQYLMKSYGFPRDAVQYKAGFIVFPSPNMAYDPTHFHPMAVPEDHIRIPKVTGDPETDFGNELIATSLLAGISPFQMQYHDTNFLIPHGDHSHEVPIRNIAGKDPYYKNALPAITGNYVQGELDRAEVLRNVVIVGERAEKKFGTDSPKTRRIYTALNKFIDDMNILSSNSTTGYINMLREFYETQVEGKTSATTANKEITDLYTSIAKKLEKVELKGYTLTVEDLLRIAQTAAGKNDISALRQADDYISAILDTKRQSPLKAMRFLNDFMSVVDDPRLSTKTRTEVATLILGFYPPSAAAQKIDPQALFVRAVEAKRTITEELAHNTPQTANLDGGEAYRKLDKAQNNGVLDTSGDLTFRAAINGFLDSIAAQGDMLPARKQAAHPKQDSPAAKPQTSPAAPTQPVASQNSDTQKADRTATLDKLDEARDLAGEIADDTAQEKVQAKISQIAKAARNKSANFSELRKNASVLVEALKKIIAAQNTSGSDQSQNDDYSPTQLKVYELLGSTEVLISRLSDDNEREEASKKKEAFYKRVEDKTADHAKLLQEVTEFVEWLKNGKHSTAKGNSTGSSDVPVTGGEGAYSGS